MSGLVTRIRSWLHRNRSNRTVSPVVAQHSWKEEDIPRYPPFMKGLPAVQVEKLLQTQAELIQQIRRTITKDEVFNRYYLPTIQRFCDYAHLLPASQSHHHRGAGGLFRHSLEVALYALQASERVLLSQEKTPAKRREMEPRWQFAVFQGALCHDAGKPVTDLTVTNSDRTLVWKPIQESLYTWANRNGIDAYFLDWREGRARQHTAMSNLVADKIIGTDSLTWIEEDGLELMIWLMESLNANPSDNNPLHNIVIQADQTSVERDLKTIGATMAGYDLGVPVERLLIDIMRRLVKEGVWQVNEAGARVWKIAGETYVVWPAGGEDMARIIREEKIPGLARTADGILDMMRERKQIQTQDDGQHYWYISPKALKQKIPEIRLQAIRLNDDTQVSAQPLQQVDGDVCESNNASGNVQDCEIQAENDKVLHEHISAHLGAENGVILTSSETGIDPQPPAGVDSKIIFSLSPESRPETETAFKSESFPVSLDGKAGEILLALLDAIKIGKQRWGKDVFDVDGYVSIRWPDAMQNCGILPKGVLEEFSSRQWLVVDPVTPWKKVQEIPHHGETLKVIRLQKPVSNAFLGAAKEVISHPAGNDVAARYKEAIEAFQTPSSNQKSSNADRPESKTVFPTVSQLMEILKNLDDSEVGADGWQALDRKLLTRKIRGEGFRCTLVFLNKLAKEEPDHFFMDSKTFRWKK